MSLPRQAALVASGLALLPAAAWAHPGHVAEAAGHAHWLAALALALAAVLAGWAGLRRPGSPGDAGRSDRSERSRG